MVVAVNADFVPFGTRSPHNRLVSAPYMGAREQDAVEQCADAVHCNDVRTRNLREEARAEHAPDRTAGIVRAERKQERSRYSEFPEKRQKVRYADARTPVGIDIDLYGKHCLGHGRDRQLSSSCVGRPR